jgi:hypothetical protein
MSSPLVPNAGVEGRCRRLSGQVPPRRQPSTASRQPFTSEACARDCAHPAKTGPCRQKGRATRLPVAGGQCDPRRSLRAQRGERLASASTASGICTAGPSAAIAAGTPGSGARHQVHSAAATTLRPHSAQRVRPTHPPYTGAELSAVRRDWWHADHSDADTAAWSAWPGAASPAAWSRRPCCGQSRQAWSNRPGV